MKKLKAEDLYRTCNIEDINQAMLLSLDDLSNIVGQERAEKALKLGVGIGDSGFNIYVSGESGTGKLTTVKKFLLEQGKEQKPLEDWCYVNNFQDPYAPTKLGLPPGKGNELKSEMKKLINDVQTSLIKTFESEGFIQKRKQITDIFEKKQEDIFSQTDDKFKNENWQIQRTMMGFLTVPVKDGKAISNKEFETLSNKEKEKLKEKQKMLQDELKNTLIKIQVLEKQASKELNDLDQEAALYAINNLFEDIERRFTDLTIIQSYLRAVKKDILENIKAFVKPSSPLPQQFFPNQESENFMNRYEVNVLIDHSQTKKVPVIVESNPNYANLFGKVEKESRFGALTTDFSLIRKGALHSANGGYLIIAVEELFRNPFSYEGLKRALKNKEIIIEEPAEQYGFMSVKSLKPEPIPLETKVLLIGKPNVYFMLYEMDADFKKLFKVKVDFDSEMKLTDENLKNYVIQLNAVCKREGFLELEPAAMAKIVEHGSRITEDQEKLSTKFGMIIDVLREANYYAREEKATKIKPDKIKKAIDEKFFRSNLIQHKIIESINKNVLMVDITGEKVGQVNGLSYASLGDVSFGHPIKITSSVSLGREGIITIEREAELSGPIHTKGVLILSGYLSEKYFQNIPVSLSARLVFEQSYGEVEGDSASSTEVYALLSSLSNLKIKQGIAVTGSVNQKGEVQAIGGVNEKIEGYFEVCKVKGFTGEQGVIIPHANVKNLMLKEEVLEKIKLGLFNIWSVQNIDEGIELLTGVSAGSADESGNYEEGTVSYLVSRKLNEFAEKMKEFIAIPAEEASKEYSY